MTRKFTAKFQAQAFVTRSGMRSAADPWATRFWNVRCRLAPLIAQIPCSLVDRNKELFQTRLLVHLATVVQIDLLHPLRWLTSWYKKIVIHSRQRTQDPTKLGYAYATHAHLYTRSMSTALPQPAMHTRSAAPHCPPHPRSRSHLPQATPRTPGHRNMSSTPPLNQGPAAKRHFAPRILSNAPLRSMPPALSARSRVLARL